ncbi:MAG: class I SAM-dependent methyltransferase [Micromonosporaceae bacterium]
MSEHTTDAAAPVQPRPPVSFDRIADRYDETRGGAKRGAEMLADIQPWLRPGPVLEVGVGTGLVAAALVAAGTPTLGVDLSPRMAARARGRLGARVAVGDARRLPVRSAGVANVLFVWALHVVGDVTAALAEASRVVPGGGRVIALHGAPRPDHTDISDALAPIDAGPRRVRTDTDEALATAGAAAGLTLIHNGPTLPYPLSRSPNQVAELIEERVWSYLWRLDGAQWQARVVPALAALRALPEPDRPRPFNQQHRVSVFTV